MLNKTRSSSKVAPRVPRYPLAQSTFTQEEIKAAKAVLDSRRFTMGTHVQAFERDFAQWTGAPYALMVNSGSSANLLMADILLRRTKVAAPLKPGDEVLVPALSWPTTVWPLVQLGLAPVFVDVDLDTLAMSLESARAAVSPRTKALFLIHALGQAPRMDAYADFARKQGLLLLEDVCESLGAHDAGVQAGNFGLLGSFSCYFSHHISTIEGGVIITKNKDLYDDLISMRAHGWIRGRSDESEWVRRFPEIDPRFMFIMGGYNVRPMEIQAAIGRVQLRKLDRMLEGRERLAAEVFKMTRAYAPWLRLIGSEHLPLSTARSFKRRDRRHSWMTLPFLLSADAPIDLASVKRRLETSGVETRSIIAGNLARHPASAAYRIRQAPSLRQSDQLLERGFMIGCHPVDFQASVDALEAALKNLSHF